MLVGVRLAVARRQRLDHLTDLAVQLGDVLLLVVAARNDAQKGHENSSPLVGAASSTALIVSPARSIAAIGV
jgi:hypothetical protein